MARITVEDCLDKVDNRFELVLVATKRARQIQFGNDVRVDMENDKPTVVALREIAENKISIAEIEANERASKREEDDETIEVAPPSAPGAEDAPQA